MRTTAIALSILTVCSAVSAQLSNEPLRNNEPYLVISGTVASSTGQNYNWPTISPAAYSRGGISAPGVGVLAGTHSWRVIVALSHYRANNRIVDGYTHLQLLSGETGTAWANGYEPEVSIRKAMVLAGGTPGQKVADFSATGALHTLAEMPMPANSNLTTVTRTFSPVSVPVAPAGSPGGAESRSVGISLMWRGGENMFKVGAHSYVYDWSANNQNYYPCGWWEAGGGYTAPTVAPNNHLWANYLTPEPTISVYSDWGQVRIAPLSPPLLGNSDGTHWSDLGRAAGGFGLSIRADGPVPGVFAAPLMNFGPFNTVGFPFFGQILELNLADPVLFTFLQAGFVLPLGPMGEADSPQFNFPAQPALVGSMFGFEAYILDGTGTITGSTGSSWINFF